MSRDRNAGRGHSVKIDNSSIERVEGFTYLGTTLTDQNSIQEEIKSRLKLGNACYHSVQNLLCSRLLSKKLKINVKFMQVIASLGSLKPTMAFLESRSFTFARPLSWACSFISANNIPWMIQKLQFMFVVGVDTVGQQPLSFLHNASGWVMCSISLPPTQLSADFNFYFRRKWTSQFQINSWLLDITPLHSPCAVCSVM